MALGLARVFGIRLPVNFYSPYKAISVVDFWRRWHVALSRFLRDYLYIPLGGNRHGPVRRYLSQPVRDHGVGRAVARGQLEFRDLGRNARGLSDRQSCLVSPGPAPRRRLRPGACAIGQLCTGYHHDSCDLRLGAVPRGNTGRRTGGDVRHGGNDREVYVAGTWSGVLSDTRLPWFQFLTLALIVFYAPNSIELVRKYRPVIDLAQFVGTSVSRVRGGLFNLHWRPSRRWAVAMSAVFAVGILQLYRLEDLTEFIYFNF